VGILKYKNIIMEPITDFTDYPSFYPRIISYDFMKKELEEIVEKLVNIKIRENMGGNIVIHKPNDV
jgi:hypothetical protein